MDTTGPVPFMVNSDPAALVPAYTVALRSKLNAAATCPLGLNVSLRGTEAAMVRRNASITVLHARLVRNASATTVLCVVPVGFRPSRQIFLPALKGLAGATVFLQVDTNGEVSTPFESTPNEFLITAAFSNQEA